ncbi:type VI secretion system baseplate subunit TssE [Aquabacter sp. L1I39]|uniref:type VI secretion system baseplate subunit TssE n=1 Tax=Aquabacter sp. L1I39 TaxID=2820278 RepID=UPI001ADA774C|nr:type VI secretion system baseplate subunit TssE [Aquabacter sp. L1I39]QTL04416.1 type VI secretion system baseplate subunit TssE [Aquabacter sp. L1I39]
MRRRPDLLGRRWQETRSLQAPGDCCWAAEGSLGRADFSGGLFGGRTWREQGARLLRHRQRRRVAAIPRIAPADEHAPADKHAVSQTRWFGGESTADFSRAGQKAVGPLCEIGGNKAMRRRRDSIRTGIPLMHAFRTAFVHRDAKIPADERDAFGRRVISGRRTTARSAVSEAVMREEIVRDVETLLNTVALASTIPLDGCEEVSRSIVNFGIPDLVHRTIDDADLGEVVEEIETAFGHFEPRIERSSLDVRRDPDVDPGSLKIRFVIACEVQLSEQNAALEFFADIALDTDKIVVSQT